MLVLVMVQPAFASLLFMENFDTDSLGNSDEYETASNLSVESGAMNLIYYSTMPSVPCHLACTLPVSPVPPAELVIELNFLGGGSSSSSSLFLCYSAGPGWGMPLPYMPGFVRVNTRTGYVIRYIRHGDGANEIKFYRNDTGDVHEIKNDWLPANPITTLRRTVIRHRADGGHVITSTFDTGVRFDRQWTFTDDRYPPGNLQRGLHVLCKGHTNIGVLWTVPTDTWIVTDLPGPVEKFPGPRPRRHR